MSLSSTEADTSSDYRLPTHPVDAKLVLSDGREEQVTLFLRPAAPTHSGPESLDEFLNGSRRFLPVKSQDSGQSFLVQRDSIQRVEVDENAPVLSHMSSELATSIDLVRIEMTDALVVEGTLTSFLPPEKNRISDFFNMAETFIPIEVEEGVTYVNKSYVTIVWL